MQNLVHVQRMALEIRFPFNDGGTVRMSTLELAAAPRVLEMRCDIVKIQRQQVAKE